MTTATQRDNMPHIAANYKGHRIHIHKRGGKYMTTWENVDENMTGQDFKAKFFEELFYYPERQQWNVAADNGPRLVETQKIGEQFDHKEVVLYFKDLGIQISWRLVFVIEYLGPLIIFPLFVLFPNIFYGESRTEPLSLIQKTGLWLTIFHYAKREMETLFIHRFSKATMPIVRLPINCFHYWILNGAFIGYFLFHPRYQAPASISPLVSHCLAVLMVIFELMNLMTHITLKNLRGRGSNARGIPSGWGFDLISCANYFWETLAWITFSILVNTFTSWVFTTFAFLQMAQWAGQKHRKYKKEFSDYPQGRWAIVPYLY